MSFEHLALNSYNLSIYIFALPDDCLKDKKVRRGEEEDAISSCMIAKVIEESMRVFWGFIRADKDEGNPMSLQNDADLGFLMEIRADLQKVNNILLSKFSDN